MQIHQSSSGRQQRLAGLQLVGLLIFAAVAAFVAIRLSGGSLSQDPDAYAQLAVTWAETGMLATQAPDGTIHPTAYRPPLYPWLLSWLVFDGRLSLVAVSSIHLLLACLLSITVWDIGKRLRIAWPWLPAILVCVDPLLIRATQQVMTELLATTLAATVWWLWLVVWPPNSMCGLTSQSNQRSKPQWFSLYLLGIFFGLSILTRPTAAMWVAMFSLCMIRFGCISWKKRLVDILAICVGVAACVLPWLVRNWAQLGEPIWGTTHGGYTMLLANNPSLYNHFQSHGADRNWDAESFHRAWATRGQFEKHELLHDEFWIASTPKQQLVDSASNSGLTVFTLGEIEDDRLAYEVAQFTIHSDPRMFLKSCIYRLGWFWSCWPNGVGKLQTAAIGTWYCVVYILAAIGLRRMFSSLEQFLVGWLPAIVLVIVLSCVHSVYWSNMRMRCPLMPSLYLLAVVGLCGKQPKIKHNKPQDT